MRKYGIWLKVSGFRVQRAGEASRRAVASRRSIEVRNGNGFGPYTQNGISSPESRAAEVAAGGEFGFFILRLRPTDPGPGAPCRAGRLAASAAATAAAFAAEHLHPLADDAELVILLAVLFPAVELQPPFDQNRRALAEIFTGNFGGSAPERHVDKRRFLDPFAVGVLAPVVDGQADFGDRHAAGDVSQLRIARQVADQDHSIEAGHGEAPERIQVPGTNVLNFRQRTVDAAVQLRVILAARNAGPLHVFAPTPDPFFHDGTTAGTAMIAARGRSTPLHHRAAARQCVTHQSIDDPRINPQEQRANNVLVQLALPVDPVNWSVFTRKYVSQ